MSNEKAVWIIEESIIFTLFTFLKENTKSENLTIQDWKLLQNTGITVIYKKIVGTYRCVVEIVVEIELYNGICWKKQNRSKNIFHIK